MNLHLKCSVQFTYGFERLNSKWMCINILPLSPMIPQSVIDHHHQLMSTLRWYTFYTMKTVRSSHGGRLDVHWFGSAVLDQCSRVSSGKVRACLPPFMDVIAISVEDMSEWVILLVKGCRAFEGLWRHEWRYMKIPIHWLLKGRGNHSHMHWHPTGQGLNHQSSSQRTGWLFLNQAQL